MYWGKTNYLHKMCTDVIEACECPTMRLWLGFEANPLMLPPQYAGQGLAPGQSQGHTLSTLSPPHHRGQLHHSPLADPSSPSHHHHHHHHHQFDAKSVWEKEHLEHFAVWLTKRTAWIARLEKAQRVEMKRRRGELIKGAAEQRAEMMSAKSPSSLGGAGSPTRGGFSTTTVPFGGSSSGGGGTATEGEDNEKEMPREKRMSMGMIMKMKHMSKGIQHAIAKRVEEDRADALLHPSRGGGSRRPSIEAKEKQPEEVNVSVPVGVGVVQREPEPPKRRDRSATSSLDPQYFAEKMGGGGGGGGVDTSHAPNTVQFSGEGGLKDKRHGLTLDQRIINPTDGGGGGGAGVLLSTTAAVAAAAASTVSSLMSQTSLPFVLAPPGTVDIYHTSPPPPTYTHTHTHTHTMI